MSLPSTFRKLWAAQTVSAFGARITREGLPIMAVTTLGALAGSTTHIGLIATAASFAFFALGVLVAAAVIGLAQVLPAWAAALIVAGGLLLIAALLVAVGVQQIKQGTPPTPTKTIDSIKQDVRVLKGTSRGTGKGASS